MGACNCLTLDGHLVGFVGFKDSIICKLSTTTAQVILFDNTNPYWVNRRLLLDFDDYVEPSESPDLLLGQGQCASQKIGQL